MEMAKSYCISKSVVMQAYKRVKANKGAAGVDGITIQVFDRDLSKNLYKIWNRMSSGSYLPPPVKVVEIPKADGKMRKLGIPTIPDRIAQMIVKIYLEPLVEPLFHPDSYGYRPKKSAIQALEVTRKRCWKYDWVIDIDIKGFFDNLDHELMMHAVKKHTQEPWILLYVQRWLKAQFQEDSGKLVERTKGTPQGGVISPLLSNIFLHHAFDEWMGKYNPQNPFERYADDIVIHCRSKEEAEKLKEAIQVRLLECKLELHPDKTRIVYCKDDRRDGNSENEKFDFLGYTFRPRSTRTHKGVLFIGFNPAMSDKAKQKKRDEVKGWLREVKPTDTLEKFVKMINPAVRGWINHYGKFHESELWTTMSYIDMTLMKWAKKKYKKLKHGWRKVTSWLSGIKKRQPDLFTSWQWMCRHDLSRRAG